MRFTKRDIIKLLDEYGRAYYNPTLTETSRSNFLKIVKAESYPLATIDELRQKFEDLHDKYESIKNGTEKTFEYFSYVDKAVHLAKRDYLPTKDVEVIDETDSENEYIPEEAETSKIETRKRRSDDNTQSTVKKLKFDDDPVQINDIPEIINDSIQCVKIDESVLQGIEQNAINAVLESLKKHNDEKEMSLNDTLKSFMNEVRSLVQNAKTEIIQTIQKKEQRINDINIKMTTLLDEQRDIIETQKEIGTLLKSTIGGQKVHYDAITKSYELQKSNEHLLKQLMDLNKK